MIVLITCIMIISDAKKKNWKNRIIYYYIIDDISIICILIYDLLDCIVSIRKKYFFMFV